MRFRIDSMRTIVQIACTAAVMLLAFAVSAQTPHVLILGTAHLSNPHHDVFNIDVDDVLLPKRQRELEDLVERVARFEPTVVALECAPAQQADFDKTYAEYRAGRHALISNEREQVGMRLAAKLNLPGVLCVDYQAGAPGPNAAYDFPDYASTHHEMETLNEMAAAGSAMVKEQTTFLQSHPLIEWYRRENQPATRQASNATYLRFFPRIGGEDGHPGANWVGGWHARNMIIVENIRRAAKPYDRVFMLFGSGHAYLLNEYAIGSGAFTVDDVGIYLR